MESLSHFILLLVVIYGWKFGTKNQFISAQVITFVSCTFGLYWIYISLYFYGNLPAFLAVLATIILSFYVSSYYLVEGYCVRVFKLSDLEIAASITVFEILRSKLFGGFPWLDIGIMQIDSPLVYYAKIIGHYGVTFVTVYCAAILLNLNLKSFVILGFFFAISFFIKNISFTESYGDKIKVALLQGAIPQDNKFDVASVKYHQDTYLKMIDEAQKEYQEIDLIILPETAFISPWNYLSDDFRNKLVDSIKKNKVALLTGIPVKDSSGWTNSVILINPESESKSNLVTGRYDKYHLVPFGEFTPFGFKWFVNLMDIPLGDFQKGELPQKPISVKKQLIGINICFEDLFGNEIIQSFRKKNLESNPTILLNVSNLAWFGDSNALSYQLKASRMRSLETERPSMRSTNTGFTAFIDKRGRLVDSLSTNIRGYLISDVQGTRGLTTYALYGEYPILFICFFVFLFRLRTNYIK
ncbi:MAG: apolipoprotein N-acyltransferase [Betaproteobacteria bacterium TMED82]|nr:MAG: apolipoprotein N-acyltransferase [Betaproteobacteria bacterium TMED82]